MQDCKNGVACARGRPDWGSWIDSWRHLAHACRAFDLGGVWAKRLGDMILVSLRDSPHGQKHIARLRHWCRTPKPRATRSPRGVCGHATPSARLLLPPE